MKKLLTLCSVFLLTVLLMPAACTEVFPLDSVVYDLYTDGETLHFQTELKTSEKIPMGEKVFFNGVETYTSYKEFTYSDRMCYELTKDNQLLPCTLGCVGKLFQKKTLDAYETYQPVYRFIMNDEAGNTFFVDDAGRIYQWAANDGNPYAYIATANLSAMDNEELMWYDPFLYKDGQIFFAGESRQGRVAYTLDVVSGALERLALLDGLSSPVYAGENQFFARKETSRGEYKVLVNMTTGKTEEYPSGDYDGFITGVVVNGNKGWIYLGTTGLHEIGKNGKAGERIYSIPNGTSASRLVYRALTGECIFTANDVEQNINTLCVVPVKTEAANELKIVGSTWFVLAG